MSELSRLKEHLRGQLLNEETDLSRIETVSNIWKTIAEAEKANAEAEKAKKSMRDYSQIWINLLPLLVTAGTLIFAIYQFRENSRLQERSIEETRWVDFAKQLSNQKILGDNLAFPTTLRYFLKSERYGNQARDIALTVLPNFVDASIFKLLFTDVYSTTASGSFDDILRLSRNLTKTYNYYMLQLQREKKSMNDTAYQYKEGAKTLYERDSVAQIEQDKEQTIVSEAIIDFIKKNRSHFDSMLELNGATLYNITFSSVDLSTANLKDVIIEYCDVSSVDFGQVTSFSNSAWDNTAWWRANKISDSLSKYLIQFYTYRVTNKYYNAKSNDSVSYKAFYDAYLKRGN